MNGATYYAAQVSSKLAVGAYGCFRSASPGAGVGYDSKGIWLGRTITTNREHAMKANDDMQFPVNSEFHCNNASLGKVLSIGGKQAAVMDHMTDALCEKFKDHPEILGNLFSLKTVPARRRQSTKPPDIGGWAAVIPPEFPQDSVRVLGFRGSTGEPNEYVVRFVGDPITFRKYTINGKSAICGDASTCPIRKKYRIEPALRHAVNLIDRHDGLLYVAEVPPALLSPVPRWAKRRGMNPGGIVAVDFSITAISLGRNTRYVVVPLDASTLTESEQGMPLYDLKRLFTPTPVDQIEARLFG